ncbi:MAG: hypothetical protein H0W82_00210 [Actinobacteria bacterium]|nr:hypothetical protein [Actinomycetota bacterium]
MSSLRRFAAPVALLTALAVACTGDGEPSPGPTQSSSSTAVPTSPAVLTPGSFRYQNAGLQVELKLNGNTGTMDVDNASGYALDKPDLYVLDGLTGSHIDGKVLDAQPVPDGEQASFQVQFPPEVTPKSLGLVILLFGSDNYGAFAPG